MQRCLHEIRHAKGVAVASPLSGCYSSDTEVLTNNGWKLFADVADTDKIMSLNMATMAQEWVGFTDRIQHRVDGELLHFSNPRVDLLVTNNHRMIARKGGRNATYRDMYNEPVCVDCDGVEGLIRADTVKRKNILPVRGFGWKGVDVPSFTLPGVTQLEQYSRREIHVPSRSIDMGDWLEFYGMWLADGCVCIGRDNPRYTVYITQSERNESYILKLFERIGFPCKIERDKTARNHNYCVYSKQLWSYLAQFGQSHDKYVSREFLDLDTPYLKRLWDGYIAGDSTGSATDFRLASVSRRLIDDMQQVILRLFGRVVQVHMVNTTYRSKAYTYYAMRFSWGNRVQNTKYGIVEQIAYHDDVFCLALQRNGTMLVRHNGIISWSGDCVR